jgi:hypothetical protein
MPGTLVDPRGLRDAIAREEARLLHLQTELGHAQARVAELKTTLAAHEGPVEISPVAPSTALEKVALFRSRFRGRDDIYPRFWSNTRTGRKGYAPACGNEWIRGVCEKPRLECGECPNQAFLPVEDKVILDHLQGRHVVGVYPLLTDDTCWFLAADFDKASWTDDVAAFAETCHAHGLPAAVERSRSGNGAHVWFFFSAPVAASAARQLGCYLITETMSRRHQLSMGSYDRLFPNQDTLPRGGFGNLIALPLQHGPRQMGNTVFIDNQFVPHPDQWRFLSTHPRIEPATVESLSREATRRGLVVGVRLSDTSDSEASEPWIAARSRNTLVLVHRQPLLDQWVAQLSMFLGVAPRDVGQIGAGKHTATGRIDVAMIQSLVRSPRRRPRSNLRPCDRRRVPSHPCCVLRAGPRGGQGTFHHRPDRHASPKRWPSPDHRDATWPRPLRRRCQEPSRPPAVRTAADRPRDAFGRDRAVSEERIQLLYAELAADERRNHLILEDVRSALVAGRSPILLTERKDHLELLVAGLQSAARHVIILRGGMTPTERRAAAATLASIPDGESRLLIATGRYIGEGFDDARLDTLFLAMPISWKGTLVQYAGRLHRLHPGKTEVRIYDYVDREVPMLARMFKKRLRGYHAIGYDHDFRPPRLEHDDALDTLDLAEPSDGDE